MTHLRGEESHIPLQEEREEAIQVEEAYARRGDVIDTLTYNNYRWQRSFYGIAAERLAAHYPRADKYEERYQEELRRAA